MKILLVFITLLLFSSCYTAEPAYMQKDGWRHSNGYKPTRSQFKVYKQPWRMQNDCPGTRGKIGY